MLWNCLFAAALIAALAMLGCLCKALVLLPMRAKDAVILLPGRGNGGDLEQNVRACLLLRRWGVLRQQIVILDRGLGKAQENIRIQNADENMEAAQERLEALFMQIREEREGK